MSEGDASQDPAIDPELESDISATPGPVVGEAFEEKWPTKLWRLIAQNPAPVFGWITAAAMAAGIWLHHQIWDLNHEVGRLQGIVEASELRTDDALSRVDRLESLLMKATISTPPAPAQSQQRPPASPAPEAPEAP